MKPSKTIYVLLFVLAIPTVAFAQCPGSKMVAGMNYAYAYEYDTTAGSSLGLFISPTAAPGAMSMACGVAYFGAMAPIFCTAKVLNFPASNYFHATLFVRFPSDAANVTGNGCIFTCPGGTCRVQGGDALPVELMEFAVEPEEDSEK